MKTLALSMRQTVYDNGSYQEKRDSISLDWYNFLLSALPSMPYVFLPNFGEKIIDTLAAIDVGGIILTGGDDIGDYMKRDITEINCIKYALLHNIPLIGICRGAQIIQHYFNGSLYTNKKHVGTKHAIKCSVDNFSFNPYFPKILLEKLPVEVNSYHNFAISEENLSEELLCCAKNIEGIDSSVEAFMHKTLPILGLMWHPERNDNERTKDFNEKIFQAFLGV